MSRIPKYRNIRKIGEGTYSVVYEAINQDTNEQVALKISRPDVGMEVGLPATSIREYFILKQLDHINILRIVDYFVRKSRFYIAFEYMETDLHRYLKDCVLLKKYETIEWLVTVKMLMKQLFDGIAHCHSNNILHRDLKPQNILMSNDFQTIKIGDFGMARQVYMPNKPLTNETATLWYRAPENILGTQLYSSPIDIWAIGCIFLQMLMGRPFFHGESEIDQLFQIFRVLGTPTQSQWSAYPSLKHYSPMFPQFPNVPWKNVIHIHQLDRDLLHLIECIFQYDPFKRITAQDALKHPYFIGS
jgi:serine/threonine protein kinase